MRGTPISRLSNDIVCNFCSESGHKQSDCKNYKGRQLYGDYAFEIAEGRAADLETSTGGRSYTIESDEPSEDNRDVDRNIPRNLDSDLLNEDDKNADIQFKHSMMQLTWTQQIPIS